jgi:hypothetical protein
LVTGGTAQLFTDLAIDTSGRLVLAGYSNNGGSLIATARYSSAGALDTSYGTGGVQTAPAAGVLPLASFAADGRLLVVGSTPRSGGGSDSAVWRFWK